MSINAIKDAIKSLAQSLNVADFLPATLFVLLQVQYVIPTFAEGFDPSSSSVLTWTVALALILSYMLYAMNYPLTRLFEGYKCQWLGFVRARHEAKRADFLRKQARVRELGTLVELAINRLGFDPFKERERLTDEREKDAWDALVGELAQTMHDLDVYYPSRWAGVLPTGLGNVIGAFEDYPRTRYGMETIVLWGRLVPLLKEKNYIEFVAQEKSVFDFLLNTCFLWVVAGVEVFYVMLYKGEWQSALVVLGLAALGGWVMYAGMVRAARHWGSTVRVAFDLHRQELHRRLGLEPTYSFAREVEQWRAVSDFYMWRPEEGEWFEHFRPQTKLAEEDKASPR